MQLSQTEFNWNQFGKRDALGSILTQPAPSPSGRWELEPFFQSGAADIDALRTRASELGLRFGGESALDFGCGIGRLTRHLLRDFESATGIDIAPSMIEQARTLNPSPGLRFLHNDKADLGILPDGSYDLVLSFITLQHIPPRFARAYIEEFLRKVRAGGTVIFQMPTESHARSQRLLDLRSPSKKLIATLLPVLTERYRLWRTKRPRMDMFGLPREAVVNVIEQSGGRLVAADVVDDTGGLVPSLRYFAQRQELRNGGAPQALLISRQR